MAEKTNWAGIVERLRNLEVYGSELIFNEDNNVKDSMIVVGHVAVYSDLCRSLAEAEKMAERGNNKLDPDPVEPKNFVCCSHCGNNLDWGGTCLTCHPPPTAECEHGHIQQSNGLCLDCDTFGFRCKLCDVWQPQKNLGGWIVCVKCGTRKDERKETDV